MKDRRYITFKFLHISYVFWKQNPSSSLWMWARFNDLLPKNRVRKGKNSNFTVEKRHHLNQVMKVNIFSDVVRITEKHFTSVGFFPKTHTSSLIIKKNLTKPSWQALCKIPGQYSPKPSRSENRRDSEIVTMRGDYGYMTAKFNMIPWIGSSIRKRTLMENWWNPNKV